MDPSAGHLLYRDDAIAWLANALSNNNNNNRLKKLSLTKTYNPSDNPEAGLVAFSNVLQNPTSALKMLDLSGNTKTEQTLASFAQALTSNKRLKKLVIGVNTPNWSKAFKNSDGYTAFCRHICNKLSIMDTFLLNHTLEKLFYWWGDGTHDSDELMYPPMEINGENSERVKQLASKSFRHISVDRKSAYSY